jgi:hypothetical protein
MRFRLLSLALFAAACGSDAPYCSEFIDISGRPTVYCPNARQDPVCDLEGDHARFVEGPMGLELVGAERATCNVEEVVICPPGTVGEPYCITDPEL